ncbi:hypothetical protein [uncultured Prevotella sp.]|jgi:hypothetical protein|uniref:hypothetical protein n=1 Tax=uncultured Prevotella sp. TaxID=159272 RepID=UPI00258457EA|nr:hypothetical protein [uncultured Prevotella sp.]
MTQQKILPYKIKALMVWLQRMKYIQGFGIQSPSAFSFDREVINNHTSYSVYVELNKICPIKNAEERKKARLLYRINRFAKADTFYFCPTKLPHYERYITAANEKTLVENVETKYETTVETASNKVAIYFFTVCNHSKTFYAALRKTINAQSFVIVDNINKTEEAKAFWHEIVDDERVSFSFDLYYMGIAFFDKRPKQNYIINF